jgi:hypothetical protein
VHPDCHVVLDGSQHSVPYRYAGQTLDAWVLARVAQPFAGTELVATHPRVGEREHWDTRSEHYPPDKAACLERTPTACRGRHGAQTEAAVSALLAERPLDRLRSVQALLRLVERVGRPRPEAACARARRHGVVRYRRVRDILQAGLDRAPLLAAAPPRRPYACQRPTAEFFGQEGWSC